MKKILILIAMMLVGTSTIAQTIDYRETVIRVIDGDTFVISAPWNPYPGLEWKIRILGIDTPEKGSLAKCKRERDLSKKATAYSKTLIDQSGGKVLLSNVQFDKYGGRFDAVVHLTDGRSLGNELIAAKFARPYNGNGPKPNWCF